MTTWNPAVDNGNVLGITIIGNTIYAVGSFTTIEGGTPRNGAAAFDLTTGLSTGWNPNLQGGVGISIAAVGGNLYVTGSFTSVGGGTPRNFAAAFDAGAGGVLPWNPNLNLASSVIRTDGSILYVGGLFTQVGGVPRNRAAALDTSGTLLAWNPDLNGELRGIWPGGPGNSMYLGGDFTTVGGSPRAYASQVDASSGAPTAWNPQPDAYVEDLLENAGVVYLVGNFSSVGNGSYLRNYAAAVDGSSSAVYTWNPNSDAALTVLYQYNPILVGGGMTSIGGAPQQGIAALVDAVGSLAVPNATATNTPFYSPTSSPTPSVSPSPTATMTPSAPVLSGPISSNGGIAIFTGTGQPGQTIFILVNGSPIGSGTAGPDGTFSIPINVGGTPINAGDTVTAAGGSSSGPGSGGIVAVVAPVGPVTSPLSPLDGGAEVITVSGIPGTVQVVTTTLDPDGPGGNPPYSIVLGSATIGPNGQGAILLSQPLAPGQSVDIVSGGILQGPTSAGGSMGQPPVLLSGSVLEEGSVLQGTGIPGSTVQAVASNGAVLGTTVVDPFGNFSLPVSGASAGQSVFLVQDGVRSPLALTAFRMGSEKAFTTANLFRPEQGGTLGLSFKAVNDGRVTVRIFNVSGDLVRPLLEMDCRAGVLYAASWDGRNGDGSVVAAGIYIISVQGAGIRTLKKVVVMK